MPKKNDLPKRPNKPGWGKPLVLWLGTVLMISVFPGNNTPDLFPHADKLIHVVLYAITCWIFIQTYAASKVHAVRQWALVMALLSAIGYGFLMEVLQDYASHRGYDIYDVIANSVGAFGYVAFVLLKKSSRR